MNKEKVHACGVNKVCNYPENRCDYFKRCDCPACRALPEDLVCVCKFLFLDDCSGTLCENPEVLKEIEMKYSDDIMCRLESLREIVIPVMKWIKDNYDLNTKVIIDCESAEVLNGDLICCDKEEDRN